MKKIVHFTIRQCYWIACFFAILFALFITVSRFFLPYLDERRLFFEQEASRALGHPVVIGRVSAWWEGVEPVFHFDNVSVMDDQRKKVILKAKNLQINVGILRSLWYRRLEVENLSVRGLGLKVEQFTGGRLSVNGLSDFEVSDATTKQRLDVHESLTWILSQPNLAFNNVSVDWRDKSGHVLPISIASLGLQNHGDGHILSGRLMVHHGQGAQLEFNLRVGGDWKDPEKLNARLYMHFDRLLLQDWLKHYVLLDKEVTKGLVNGKLWVGWRQGHLRRTQLVFQGKNVTLHSKKTGKNLDLQYAYGQLAWRQKKNNKDWELAGDHLLFSSPNYTSQVGEFKIEKTYPKQEPVKTQLWINYIDLKNLSHILLGGQFLPDNVTVIIKSLALEGIVKNFLLTYEGEKPALDQIQGRASIQHVSFKRWKMPGIKNFSGRIAWDHDHGLMLVDSHDLQLTDPDMFLKPITLQDVAGEVYWHYQPDQGIKVFIKDLSAKDHFISLLGHVAVSLPKDKPPLFSVLASAALNDASKVINYLPARTFKPKLSHWLKQAFLSGLASATVASHGILDGKMFPYQKNPGLGKFIADINLDHLLFRINDDFPLLSEVKGRLVFSRNHMTFEGVKGSMVGSPVTQLALDIPDMGDKKDLWLYVKSRIQSEGKTAILAISQSPVWHKVVGKALSHDQLSGPLVFDLQMKLPLAHLDSGLEVFGQVDLLGNQYQMSDAAWSLNELHGNVRFTHEGLLPSFLKGRLFDAPITLRLMTERDGDKHLSLKGYWRSTFSVKNLTDLLHHSLSQFAKGGAVYDGFFTSTFSGESARTDVKLMSELKGLSLNLPEPFGKTVDEKKAFSLDFLLAGHAMQSFKLSYQGKQHLSIDLHPEKRVGFDIKAYVSSFIWSEWAAFMKSFPKVAGSTFLQDIWARVNRLQVTVGHMEIVGQAIEKPVITVTSLKSSTRVHIKNKNIWGEIAFMQQNNQRMISADFKRLYLTPFAENSKSTFVISPKILPSMHFHSDDFRYDKKSLAHVTLNVSRVKNGVKIDKLSASSANVNINVEGAWIQNEKGEQKTYLKGGVKTNHLDDLFKQWHYASSLEAKKASATFALSWPDTPYQPQIDILQGSADVTVGRGVITHLDKSATAKLSLGRLLNLLSLETIARRLTLNFSNISKKGYVFDSLKAKLSFEGKNLQVQRLETSGSVADIELSGRVGLGNKDYNMVLSVTPNITGSLPLVAGIVTINPIVGLATWVVNKILSHEVGKLTTYHYKVTGPWESPDVQPWVKKN